MGTDTSGYTLTDERNIFAVMRTIEETVKGMGATLKNWRINAGVEMAVFSFSIPVSEAEKDGDAEERNLYVHFNCYTDYTPEPQPKIIYTLGCWGRSADIILAIVKAMNVYGPGFYCANDSSEDFVPFV